MPEVKMLLDQHVAVPNHVALVELHEVQTK